ncbi:MAG: hypothetical protein IJG50_02955 [Clostridia bacterium]|nr:hypothetical protein [Clostridia bacterium]
MNKLRKHAFLPILLIVVLVMPLFVGAEGAVSTDTSFSVASKNAILVEATTDTVIYQKNINDRIVPGELTKLMTAIIAVEYGMLDDIVTISETAATDKNAYGTLAALKAGEQLSVRQLLYCMILDNNDVAAVAIAEHISGTEEDFARSMTQKAAFIGAQNTNFTNATGQNERDQYSTVWDMYIIADYFMQSKLLMEIASTRSYTLPQSEWRAKKKKIYTNDHLISTYKNTSYYYRYADGLIGGSSSASGSVVAAAASRGRGSMTLIFIGAGTSGENSKYSLPAMKDAGNVFREAYSSYKIMNVVKKGEIMMEAQLEHSLEKDYISLVAKDDVSTVIPQNKNEDEIEVRLFPNEHIMAPISAGDTLGTFEVYDNDVLIVTGTLTSEETIRANIILKIGYWITSFFSLAAVKVIIVIILLLAAAYIFILVRSIKRNEQKKAKMKQRAETAAAKRAPSRAISNASAPKVPAGTARRSASRAPHTLTQADRRTKAKNVKSSSAGGRVPRAHNKTVKTTSPGTRPQKQPKQPNTATKAPKVAPSSKKGRKLSPKNGAFVKGSTKKAPKERRSQNKKA